MLPNRLRSSSTRLLLRQMSTLHSPPSSPHQIEKRARLDITSNTNTIPQPTPTSALKLKSKQATKRIKRQPVDEVLWNDINLFLGKDLTEDAKKKEFDWKAPLEVGMEVVVRAGAIGSGGQFSYCFRHP